MSTCCRTPPGGRSSFIQSYAAHLAAGYRTETIDKIHFRVKQDVENMAHQQHRVSTCSRRKENTACVALDTWVLFREDTIEITMVSQWSQRSLAGCHWCVCYVTAMAHRLRLHVPSMSPFLIRFKNGFSVFLWCCLHITSKRSKMPLTKIMTLTAYVNEPLRNLWETMDMTWLHLGSGTAVCGHDLRAKSFMDLIHINECGDPLWKLFMCRMAIGKKWDLCVFKFKTVPRILKLHLILNKNQGVIFRSCRYLLGEDYSRTLTYRTHWRNNYCYCYRSTPAEYTPRVYQHRLTPTPPEYIPGVYQHR